MTILDPQIVEQLIDCLRSSGRFKPLRKLTVRIRCDIVMSPLWSLLCDAAATLEELQLELDSGDNAFGVNTSLVHTLIEAPQLTSLLLHLGDSVLYGCNARIVGSCVSLLTCLHPSAPLSLTLDISMQCERAEEIKSRLKELDLCLMSPIFKNLASVHMMIFCVRRLDRPPPLIEEEVKITMPSIERAGLLRISLGNTTVSGCEMSLTIYGM
jgi:hypothetical protein